MTMVEAESVSLSYGATQALRGASLSVSPGEVVALVGPSGAGKSSLLYCVAGLARPDSGRVMFDEIDLASADDETLTRLRRERFGFVFQFGELVPELTILENVSLPLRLQGSRAAEAAAAAADVLGELGIDDLAARLPSQVSGGQAQRAAVARALVHEPAVVYADEPTGALDSESSDRVLERLLSAARSRDAAVVLVTHDMEVAGRADRTVEIVDGREVACRSVST